MQSGEPGQIVCLATTILPKLSASVKAENVISVDGGAMTA
jgi:hypothetical protein